MGFINALRSWFTAQRRQAIYVAVAGIVPVLVLSRVITDAQTEFVLTITSVVLQVFAGLLQLFNLTPGEAADQFITSGRAAIYTLAVAAAPAAVGLGWITDAQSANVLTIVSVGLTVLGAIIGVVYLTPDAPSVAPAVVPADLPVAPAVPAETAVPPAIPVATVPEPEPVDPQPVVVSPISEVPIAPPVAPVAAVLPDASQIIAQ